MGGVTGDRAALPRLLVSVRDPAAHAMPPGAGLLAHHVALTDLVRLSSAAAGPVAVDLDVVDGLAPDEAALVFLRERLRITIVVTRRPLLAARALAHGIHSLLHVHCLDSTGLEHAMAAHPGPPVGTAISPGPILAHLSPEQRGRLPGPVLAYGLIVDEAGAAAALAAGADAVVVPDARTGLSLRYGDEFSRPDG